MTKAEMKDAMFPDLKSPSGVCAVCDDVGIATFEMEDGSLAQRVCNEPECKGAATVQEELERMTKLLSAIDDYKQINLTRAANKVVVNRYRTALFEEYDRYQKFLKKSQITT